MSAFRKTIWTALLAFAAALAFSSAAITQTTCGQQATKTGISTLVEVIQGSGSATAPALGGTARIYVCGYTASISAAGVHGSFEPKYARVGAISAATESGSMR